MIKPFRLLSGIILLLALGQVALAQTGTVRGFVYDQESGEPLLFTTIYLLGTTYGSSTDDNGFYSITKVPPGEYRLAISSVEYDTTSSVITVEAGKITNQSLYLNKRTVEIEQINISAEREEATTEVQVSTIKIKPKEISQIPSIGGEADIAQYLQILPGVIFTGDQGGQLYIRGGSPVQTKVLLDGITIYNPFHSIGLFSVFETDNLRSVDVYTGGFNAEYGGRISAVVDIKTRDGNKYNFGGKISASPFMAKATLEGPIAKIKRNRKNPDAPATVSFLLNSKISYLDKTSKGLYAYVDSSGIPFSFQDFYGKLSFNAKGGSKVNLFGFNFRDNANYRNTSEFEWKSFGIGANFVVVPGQSKAIIGGNFAYSNYSINLRESDNRTRTSFIGGFNIGLDFTYFLKAGEFKYGFEVNGYKTSLTFPTRLNPNVNYEASDNTTELAFFLKYKQIIKKRLILEPSLRAQYYASISNFSFEPRLGLKVNITDELRFKAAGGIYTQNLISGKSDRDVVNLFNSYLSSPERVINPDGTSGARLQKAYHAIGGIEYDVTKSIQISLEGYLKHFADLININRNKGSSDENIHEEVADADFVSETGRAYGVDFLLNYNWKKLHVWATYSLGWVERNDGQQVYHPHYDRRHNTNLVVAYSFGKKPVWEVSARWNFGSGFPFTKTQAFFPDLGPNFVQGGIGTDYTSANTDNISDIGILYEEDLDGGRLPYYHRLDLSVKCTFNFTKNTSLDIIASLTNVYNRENIFYFDRILYERVNQLPILPSLAISLSF